MRSSRGTSNSSTQKQKFFSARIATKVSKHSLHLIAFSCGLDLGRMYRLLSRVADGTDSMRSVLETHICEVGRKAVDSLGEISSVCFEFYSIFRHLTSSLEQWRCCQICWMPSFCPHEIPAACQHCFWWRFEVHRISRPGRLQWAYCDCSCSNVCSRPVGCLSTRMRWPKHQKMPDRQNFLPDTQMLCWKRVPRTHQKTKSSSCFSKSSSFSTYPRAVGSFLLFLTILTVHRRQGYFWKILQENACCTPHQRSLGIRWCWIKHDLKAQGTGRFWCFVCKWCCRLQVVQTTLASFKECSKTWKPTSNQTPSSKSFFRMPAELAVWQQPSL